VVAHVIRLDISLVVLHSVHCAVRIQKDQLFILNAN
jgi:hypothetical protein